MTKSERQAYMDWIADLVEATMRLITNGRCDPSAYEIASRFYDRQPMRAEVNTVKDALRDVIDYATEAKDDNGNLIWGLKRTMLTPLCGQYYDGVYVPYKTRAGRKRNRKVIPRGATPEQISFITHGLGSVVDGHIIPADFGVVCTPIGGGKTYTGLYYTETPLADPISLAWIKFMARSAEGARIKTQGLIRDNGGDLNVERNIFAEADQALQDTGRRDIPAPLRQESLEESHPLLLVK